MKYILYSTEDEWNESNSDMNTHFGLPDSNGTARYATIQQVENSKNADYGKYIFPVCDVGDFICTNLFPADEQVDYNQGWPNPEQPPE